MSSPTRLGSAGTDVCFLTQMGAINPSGNSGDPGVYGESGDLGVGLGPEEEVDVVDGGGGVALAGGRRMSCRPISISSSTITVPI